ncbi:MAG: hypothetical protein Unbinned1524contig1003_2 [Prokaryotic dsDNA virus sp.]|nr:MAG: hypothetical protein Unbinned1524contig1003_2 [Prokaryotic dsDNA virus sp.]|tara:strand:- start:13805 stop:15595 length:1791 start_codon:yes stop_codon:yes gene_type:complete
MSYGSSNNLRELRNRPTQTRNIVNSKTSNIELGIKTPEGDYLCQSNKQYVDKASIIQEVDNTDSFITLSSFDKNLAALTVHNAKALVIKNIGTTALEISLKIPDWRNDGGSDGASDTTTDVANSIDVQPEGTSENTVFRFQSMLLPVGDFIYLPTSRLIGYSPYTAATPESGANSPAGYVAKEPKDINSGNEFTDVKLFSGTTYAGGAAVLTDEAVDIDEVDINVDDGDWFEAGDLIMIDSEVMEIENTSANRITVKRGLLGSTAVAHDNDDPLFYFFGNENLKFNNGRCQTDQNGNFKQRGAFFGYGRTADKLGKGLVAGSVAIGPFYTKGGYLDWGLENIKASDETGLTASTTYTFTIVVDDFQANGFGATDAEQAIAFTTDSSDTTFAGSGNAVLPKIQAIFDEKFYDASSGLFNKKVTITLHNGDIRVTSHSNHSGTIVGIGNTTGTTPFSVGRFPAKDGSSIPILKGTPTGSSLSDAAITIVYGPKSTLDDETLEDPVTGKEIQNTNAFLIDDGNGNLTHNGSVVGNVNYAKGHCEFNHLPNAEFKVYAETLAAHSGGVTYTAGGYNSIQSIGARSINAKKDGKVEVLLLG